MFGPMWPTKVIGIFQTANGLRWLQEDECISGPVHIHFDLDVLSPQEFPFLAYPEPTGMPIATATSLLRRLAEQSDIVGLTFTEFAPSNKEDARIGSRTIAAFCDVVCNQPNMTGAKVIDFPAPKSSSGR